MPLPPYVVLRLLLAVAGLTACQPAGPLYRDAGRPVEARVTDLLGRMTTEEKFWQVFAVPDDTTRLPRELRHGIYGLQVRGEARAVAARVNAIQRHLVTQTRLGIPMIPFEEGLHGLAQPGATVFPQAIALAATWDTALVGRVAGATASEARARGIRQLLSPVLNIASDARWGRVEETYGEDPWLSSRMAVAFVSPIERSGVATTPKHFVANVGDGGRDSYPIDLGARGLAEVHYPPFEAAIREGGARSVMASYNSVQGLPASASPWLLRDQLRRRLGLRGVVISDAGAVGGANVLHMTSNSYATSGQHALEAGLDVIFQTSVAHAALFWPALAEGKVARAALDSAVARVLRLKFQLGLFEHPYVSEDSAAPAPAHRDLAREVAGAAITLLANDGKRLPLKAPGRGIALIGTDAAVVRLGGYSGPGTRLTSLRDALAARLGATRVFYDAGPGRGSGAWGAVPASRFGTGLAATFHDNITLAGPPVRRRADRQVDFTWTLGPPDSSVTFGWYSVRWTGTLGVPAGGPVRLRVDSDDGARLYIDDRLVVDTWRRPSGRGTDEMATLTGGRAYRIRLEYHQDVGPGHVRLLWDAGVVDSSAHAMTRAAGVARRADVAVVVVGVEEGEFRDRARLALPGHQEALIEAVAATGTPVIVVIVGGSAVTMTRWIDRVSAVMQVWYPGEAGGDAIADVLLGRVNPAGRLPITIPRSEGQLPLTYFHKPTGRGDDYLDLTGRPLFPFGHGLSYSTFSWSGLTIEPPHARAGDTVRVRVTVHNEGPLPGDEVVQAYLRDEVASVARPVLMLAAFARVSLAVGESKDVLLTLRPDRFALLDAALRPVVEPGRFVLMVGASSADIRLRGIITVDP